MVTWRDSAAVRLVCSGVVINSQQIIDLLGPQIGRAHV